MRENLDQWDYVFACYVIGVLATMVTMLWAWAAMRRAEKRRDEVKRK